MRLKLLIPLLLLIVSTPMLAKTTAAKKAKSSCRECDVLKKAGEVVATRLKDLEINDEITGNAVVEIRDAIVGFLKSAGTLDDRDLEAIIQAWVTVSIYDTSDLSIPEHKDIQSKISRPQFRKIQLKVGELGQRLCQPGPTNKKKPQPPSCSLEDEKLKRAYMAVSLSIMQALSDNNTSRENP